MRILVVCLGNICRSPTAEAALTEAFAAAGVDAEVESAGTGSWHVGAPPDRRMTAAAAAVGLELSGTARRFSVEDFDRFDLILAADRSNLRDILALARDDADRDKVRLFLEFDPERQVDEVPDPYYGGPEGFERVVDIVRAGARGVLDHVRAAHR